MNYSIAFALGAATCLLVGNALAQSPAPASDTPAPIVIQITQAANLRTLADKAGYDGNPRAYYVFNIAEKIVVMGRPGNRPGIDTGVWPQGVKLALTVGGAVYGGGGRGGDGGDIPGTTEGGHGGDAIVVHAPITILVGVNGAVKAGGGGGGGADGGGTGGSGGGGGFPNGERGNAGSPSHSTSAYMATGDFGHDGSPAGGGLGGQRGNVGGKGGDAAQPGETAGRPGGGPGNAIRANDNKVQLYPYGQIIGEVY